MKKLALVILIGLLLLAGSLGLFSGNSTEAKLDASLPVIQNTRGLDFKTASVVPGKDEVPNKEAIMAKAAAMAVPFVKNAGQFNAQVKYAADLFSGRFFLTDKELVYSLLKREKAKKTQPGKFKFAEKVKRENVPGKGLAFKEYFVDKKGAKIDFKSSGEQQAATVVSYFRGNDPAKWQSSLASYKSVSLGEVYPGIEVKLKASGKNVEKVFIVSPGSNVTAINIGVAGVKRLKIAKDGRLLFKNTLGELAMRAPVAWQEINGQKHHVKVGYCLLGKKQYGFVISGDYDKKHPLIIDPALDTIIASTFLGGSGEDAAYSLALDSSGNVYIAGYTSSPDFPTTIGAYDRTFNSHDAFVAKLNTNLTTLLASTFLGGSGRDESNSLTLDSAGNVYLTGWTESGDFPTTPGAYDRTINDSSLYYGGDAFVAKLDSSLTQLLASTYLGGGDIDIANSLALDSAGNVWVTGETTSADFPTTIGAYEQTYNWSYISSYGDVFISKLDSNLTTLLASTFLGGSGEDIAYSLALDSSGNVYIAGYTLLSPDFPTTIGAYDQTYNVDSNVDAFISRLDNNLTTLLASTYLGGSYGDFGNSLALDSAGNVYLAGNTKSPDFPTTIGAYDREINPEMYGDPPELFRTFPTDIFISKLNGNLTELLASTYLGGEEGSWWILPNDYAFSLALDSAGNVYIAGYTLSPDFPTTIGAYDRTYNNSGDAFVSKLNNNLTTLLDSTYLGGSSGDEGSSLALDSAGNVFLTGHPTSADFPTTPGAYDRTPHSVFVAKLNGNTIGITVVSPNGGESWNNGSSQNITWTSLGTIGNVAIDYSVNNGGSWIHIAATANDGSYAWTVPGTPSNQCLVRVSDAAYPAISDSSDAVFSITNTPPQVEIISPENNAQVYGVVTVMANATDDVGIARVEFYVDGVLKGQAATAQTAAKKIRLASGTSGNSRISKKTLIHSADPQLRAKVSSANAQYTFTWNTMDASQGTHVLRVVAYDEAEAMGFNEITVQVLKVNLELQAERREVKAFSILRQYGLIQFTVDNPGIPVAAYRIMRSKGSNDFSLLKAVAPSELQNNQFQMQDKYLEKGTQYTYIVEAYNSAGQLVGRSAEKTI